VGGPVSPSVGWLVHSADSLYEGSVEVAPGIQLSTSQEILRKVAEADDGNRRLFAGYAGWAPHQLEREISAGAWITCDAPEHKLIFSEEPDKVWSQVMFSMGIDPLSLVPGSLDPS